MLEKYAVRWGGGTNHRAGWTTAILIKDNHMRLAGGVGPVEHMRAAGPEMPVEIEVETLAEVDQALAAGADIVLVDNLSTDDMREAVGARRAREGRDLGRRHARSAARAGGTGADYVSIGALTHSARAADLSFEIEPDV